MTTTPTTPTTPANNPAHTIHLTKDDLLINGQSIPWVIDTDIKITPAQDECDYHNVTITLPCEQITIDSDAMRYTTVTTGHE